MAAANGQSLAIERDPRFTTWEDERTWLVARELELVAEREGVDADAERDAYLAAEAEGFEVEYCEAVADKIAARRKEIKQAMRDVRLRLTLIAPLLRKEREQAHTQPGRKHQRWEASHKEKNRHQELLERIAVAVEQMASALNCDRPRRRKRKAGAA